LEKLKGKHKDKVVILTDETNSLSLISAADNNSWMEETLAKVATIISNDRLTELHQQAKKLKEEH